MGETRSLPKQYQVLVVLVLFLVALSASVLSSCGSGGGDGSDGGLCDQCGNDPDGPCQFTALVRPGATEPEACPSPDMGNPNGCVPVDLICRRKVDSAQQRCYPAVPGSNPPAINFQFRCDGSRPGGTAVPEPTATSTPQASATPVPTKTLDPDSFCGDGVVEGLEECDGSTGTRTCADFCDSSGGGLRCTGCQFDVSSCTGGNCSTD